MSFTTETAARLAQVGERTLNAWIAAGVILPENGRLTIDELLVLLVVADLSADGMTATPAARLAAWLRIDTDARGLTFIDPEGFVLDGPAGAAWITDLSCYAEDLAESAGLVGV